MRLTLLALGALLVGCSSATPDEEVSSARAESQQTAAVRRVGVFAGAGAGGEYVTAIRNSLAGDERFAVSSFWDGSVSFSDFDVVVFPGGSGSGEWNALGWQGQQNLKAFVRGGGGFIGICAGFYLALPGSADFFDADIYLPWARGDVWLAVDVPEGNGALSSSGQHWLRWVNGPLIYPLGNRPYSVLATFGSSIADGNETFVGKPAVVGATVGSGHVVGFSPHPELSGVEVMLKDAVVWASPNGGSIDRPEPQPEPAPADPCRGFDAVGTCTGTVLEWCEGGVYKRFGCSTKTNGRTNCGADPNPALGNNCI